MQNSQQSLLADNEVNADDEESSQAPRYPMGRLMVSVGLVGAVCLIALVAAGPNLDSSQSSDSADAGGLWGRVSSWWHNRGKGNTAPPSCSECVAGSGESHAPRSVWNAARRAPHAFVEVVARPVLRNVARGRPLFPHPPAGVALGPHPPAGVALGPLARATTWLRKSSTRVTELWSTRIPWASVP